MYVADGYKPYEVVPSEDGNGTREIYLDWNRRPMGERRSAAELAKEEADKIIKTIKRIAAYRHQENKDVFSLGDEEVPVYANVIDVCLDSFNGLSKSKPGVFPKTSDPILARFACYSAGQLSDGFCGWFANLPPQIRGEVTVEESQMAYARIQKARGAGGPVLI